MRSKLNPDGSKIRSLRIQRGWTQDQLAEIAGISSRTIQRAEAADCAAFETVRAIAGAFETDFDQLLKHNTEPPVNVERALSSTVGIEPIAINPAKSVLPHRWAMSLVAVSTLFLGVVAGVILTSHLEMGEESDLLAVPRISAPSPQVERSEVNLLPMVNLSQSVPKKRISAAKTQLPIQHRNPDLEESCGNQVSKTPVAAAADPGSGEIIERSQTTESLNDLVPRPQEPLPELVISESPSLWNNIPVLTEAPQKDEPVSGVLREAMNTAARKTGAFVSKAGESVRRVF